MGWLIPAPSARKGGDELRGEREQKVAQLVRRGLLRSEPLRRAMLCVPREEFVPRPYRDHAYEEVPLPLPGRAASISCPHSYPLFYEALELGVGHRFLEVGTGSGYGAALAREVVGPQGLVVSMEIDPDTLAFASANLATTRRPPCPRRAHRRRGARPGHAPRRVPAPEPPVRRRRGLLKASVAGWVAGSDRAPPYPCAPIRGTK